MIILIPIILLSFISFISFIGYHFIFKKKSENICLGKVCTSNSDCYCDDTDTCLNGKCCSSSCSGKNCDENNTCGEPCSCPLGKKCLAGNCCTPNCDIDRFGKGIDGCGGDCVCLDGYVPFITKEGKNKCIPILDCTKSCEKNEVSDCSCNEFYCPVGKSNCCGDGGCKYEDICNIDKSFILKGNWAQFCQTPNLSCNLTNVVFKKDRLRPESGTLTCTLNSDSDKPISSSITINDAYYYYTWENDTLLGQKNTLVGHTDNTYNKSEKTTNKFERTCVNVEDCEGLEKILSNQTGVKCEGDNYCIPLFNS